jgi:hypothetical protein
MVQMVQMVQMEMAGQERTMPGQEMTVTDLHPRGRRCSPPTSRLKRRRTYPSIRRSQSCPWGGGYVVVLCVMFENIFLCSV